MATDYPVLLWNLEETDPEWVAGFRHIIEDKDGDKHFMRSKEDAIAFAGLHGMKFYRAKEMERIRSGGQEMSQ